MTTLILILVLRETRSLLARPDNDFAWSSWNDQSAALQEIEEAIALCEQGKPPYLPVLYAPTGPIQEVSLSSGWGQEFLAIAEQFDLAWAKYSQSQ